VDAEGDMRRLVGIIDSMTPSERENPTRIIDPSRRRRIAAGAGVEPHEINELVKQFDGMAKIMTSMASMGIRERMKKMQELQRGGMLNPGSRLQSKGSTGKRLTAQEREKIKKQKEREQRKKKREEREKKNQPDNHE
jgi:signal recognition particle subunit SRP54